VQMEAFYLVFGDDDAYVLVDLPTPRPLPCP
jgi:hypothetical protein